MLAATATSLVLPEQLAQQAADAVRELLAEAAAENTTRSYSSALRYWAGWHAARYGIELALPVPEATVLQFVVDHVQRRSADGELAWELPPAVDQALVAAGLKAKLGPWTLATVRHRVAVLSTAHRLKEATNPCEQPAIRTVLSRAARAAVKRGERPRKKTAITLAELEAMLATCDNSLDGIRDRALLCLGSLVAAAGAARSLRPTFATCAGLARRAISTGWSTARPSRLGLRPPRPRISRCSIGPPSPSRTGWRSQALPRGPSSGGCGSSASALPCPLLRWVRSCSGGRAWLVWRGSLAGIASGPGS